MSAALSLSVVRFCAAGHAFAMEACHVREMRLQAQGEWENIEDLLGLSRSPDTVRRWLRLGGRGRELAVDEPVSLGEMAVTAIHPLPPLLQQVPCLPGLAALALEGDRLSLLLEPGLLPEQEHSKQASELEKQP